MGMFVVQPSLIKLLSLLGFLHWVKGRRFGINRELAVECDGTAINPQCWSAAVWAQKQGVYANPEYYSGLTAKSRLVDFVSLFSGRNAQEHCTMPTSACGCKSIGPSVQTTPEEQRCFRAIREFRTNGYGQSNLTDASSDGDIQLWLASSTENICKWPCPNGKPQPCQGTTPKCWQSVIWAQHQGIYANPSWYPGCDAQSPLVNFIDLMGGSKENAGCYPQPQSCQCHSVGPDSPGEYEACWRSIQWGKYVGLYSHPEWYNNLTVSASYSDIQLVLWNKGQYNCPLPCTLRESKSHPKWTRMTSNCASGLAIKSPVVMPSHKGINLDDTTFQDCSGEIPLQWPNTVQELTSIRLFKARVAGMSETQMMRAWANLKTVAKKGVKFLVGTPITCNKTYDDEEFDYVLRFVKYIGEQNFMGFAIGNEVELLQDKSYTSKECADRLRSEYSSLVLQRVAAWDLATHMTEVPITAVVAVLQRKTASNMVKAVYAKLGSRFVVTHNLYPQFSPMVRGDHLNCSVAVDVGTNFAPDGWVPSQLAYARKELDKLGAANATIWIGEVGWLTGNGPCKLDCYEACHSKKTLEKFYRGFLTWNLTTTDNVSAHHAFYFSLRDSVQFGMHESFGLIPKCGDSSCKLSEELIEDLLPAPDSETKNNSRPTPSETELKGNSLRTGASLAMGLLVTLLHR